MLFSGEPTAKQAEAMMSTERRASISGIDKDGVVVPQSGESLAESTRVEIVVESTSIPDDLQAEMEAWTRLANQTWARIEKWEAEEE